MGSGSFEGFIIDSLYKVVDGKSFIFLYGRFKSGESFSLKKIFKPYFFVNISDLDKIKKLGVVAFEDCSFKSFSNNAVSKIVFNTQDELINSRKLLEENNVETFEADIRPEQRFILDFDILGSVFVKGKYIKGDGVDLYFDEPDLLKSDWTPSFDDLSILSFDIETDMQASSIFSLSVVTNKGDGFVFIVGRKGLKNAVYCADERDLLLKFIDFVLKFDPDVIVGWNLIDFDLKVIAEKLKEHKLDFAISRTKGDIKLKIVESFMMDSKASCEGRVVLDGIHLLKTSFVRLDDYKLGTAAKKFTKSSKLIGDENKGEEIEEAYLSNPQKLVDYNLLDSRLVIDILRNSGVFDLTILRSRLTGMLLDRVRASIASFDSLYIRALHSRGFVAPSSSFKSRDVRTTGGFVMESSSGIYDFVLVCDFKSLYPSIMRTFNIDPLMFSSDCKEADLIKAPNGACFKREKGILPMILEDLWAERERARVRGDALTRQAIKISMNSMYGVLASPNCRFYSVAMANAITHFGHLLLKKTKEIVEERGFSVIYGDTDSVFVSVNAKDVADAKKLGVEIESLVNNFFKKFIKDKYSVESRIEMEFEKTFRKFFLPRMRGSDEGAKKRYAGLLVKDGAEVIDFTGLEFVRRDWTEVSKKFQLELLERVFKGEPVDEFIKSFVNNLKSGKYDSLLVYRKALRKGVDDYTKTTPPHVKAARLLDKISSNIIEYVLTVEGPEPVSNQKNKIDYDHYIDKQIKPLADSVLCFFNSSFDDVIAGSQQRTLGDW
ncbi:MAG: DNA polymerase II [Candidatus Woesearchaeota archaeon]